MAMSFRTAADTESEREAVADLQATVSEYDLSPWTFTEDVVVEEGAIPHSHPVLTLRARNRGTFQLASLLHEQCHWFCTAHDPDVDRLYREVLRTRYPSVPVGSPDGAATEESTYLHLVVCWQEIAAVTRLIGHPAAEMIVEACARAGLYGWVYRTVLECFDELGEIYGRYNLHVG